MCEQVLLAAAKQGQTEAFGALCEPLARKLVQSAQRITRNREDAEDALQDAFMSAFIHIKNFDGRSSFSTWTATAINTSPCDKCGVRPGSIEILSGQVKSGQRWSGQNRPTDVARDLILLTQLLLIRQACFRSPAPWSAFQDVTVV